MLASAAHHYHQHQCRRRNLFSHCFALDAIRKLCSAAFIAPFKGRRLANRLMNIFFLLLCGIANCQWVNATAAAAAAAHQTAIFVQLELLGGQKEKLQLVYSSRSGRCQAEEMLLFFFPFWWSLFTCQEKEETDVQYWHRSSSTLAHFFVLFQCLIESLSFRWPVTQIGLRK